MTGAAATGRVITIEALCIQFHPLDRASVERWIGNAWVQPDGPPGAWHFREVDVARIRLIVDLRDALHVEEDTLPVVLSLLDQLYDARRALRRLHGAVRQTVPDEVQAKLREVLAGPPQDASPGLPSGQ